MNMQDISGRDGKRITPLPTFEAWEAPVLPFLYHQMVAPPGGHPYNPGSATVWRV
jgi:hypothetical protein